MALNPVPWAINGGKIDATDARRLAYNATAGATGVIRGNDFRVVASAPLGASVLVYSGSGAIATSYPLAAPSQSYIVSADTSTTVPVAPTTGAARTDYLIIKVTDPQYGGQAPSDPVNGPYVSFALVSSITNLAYPFMALAKIAQPANNGAVTQAMITPLRDMANPRRKRDVSTFALTNANAETQTVSSANGEIWPNAATAKWGSIAVPAWATQARVTCSWCQVKVPPGNVTGTLWVQLGADGAAGTQITQAVAYDTPGLTNNSRSTFMVGDTLNIPVALRGTSQPFRPKARWTAGASAGRLVLDGGSAVVLDFEFLESPTEDD